MGMVRPFVVPMQVDMVSLITGVVAKQAELQQDIRSLKAQLDRVTRQQQVTQFI